MSLTDPKGRLVESHMAYTPFLSGTAEDIISIKSILRRALDKVGKVWILSSQIHGMVKDGGFS